MKKLSSLASLIILLFASSCSNYMDNEQNWEKHHAKVRSMANIDMMPDTMSYYIPERKELSKNDSIGYVHNAVMEYLVSQTDKYISEDGIDYDLIYDDCVEALKGHGIYNDTLTNDIDFKREIIKNGKEMAELQNKVIDEASYNSYCQSMTELIKEKELPSETVTLFKEYLVKVSDMCDKLSDEQRAKYANELFNAIDESEMTNDQKEEVASSTNVLVNSSMYWEREYSKNNISK